MLSMCFIFALLPIILIVSKNVNIFFLTYLACIELMIIAVVLLRVNEEYVNFNWDRYKITIWCGIFKVKFSIICDKVALIHTAGQGGNLEIIIITKSRFRNKRIVPIDINFLKKNPYVAKIYNKIKTDNLEESYFYVVIKHGGFSKYILLDELYKSCVHAVFSDDAIESIKEYREN